jgi:hypothetical protein
MLTLIIQEEELWDETDEVFITHPEIVLELEHSLVSLSKWEEKYEKPFLSDDEKTDDETLYYVECMILSPDDPEEALKRLTNDHLMQVNDYINKKMTATWFNERDQPKRSSEQLTAELIHYWMIQYSIPLEWETRHLNKLFTLIRVINTKNSKPKKRSMAELAAERRAENARRRAALGTTG